MLETTRCRPRFSAELKGVGADLLVASGVLLAVSARPPKPSSPLLAALAPRGQPGAGRQAADAGVPSGAGARAGLPEGF